VINVLYIRQLSQDCRESKNCHKIVMRSSEFGPWFSRLLRHPARKWSRPVLITPEPSMGYLGRCLWWRHHEKVIARIVGFG